MTQSLRSIALSLKRTTSVSSPGLILFLLTMFEFYHEKHGLISTRKTVMQMITKHLCGGSNKVRREIVEGSLRVYAIKDFGALEIGEHRFYLTQKGQQEKLDGIGKFANLWQKRDGKWRMSRVFSYGF